MKNKLQSIATRVSQNSLIAKAKAQLKSVVGRAGDAPVGAGVTTAAKSKSLFEASLADYTDKLTRSHDGLIEVGDLRRTLAYLPPVNGYSAPFSVRQGERVDLHLARNVAAPTVVRNHAFQCFRDDLKVPVKRRILIDPVTNKYLSQVDFPGGVTCRNELPKSHKGAGAGYTARFGLNTAALSPGLYEARFVDGSDTASEGIYFNVRPVDPGADQLVVILPTMTWQAYNRVGGGSFYSTGIGKKREVSMLRPLPHKYADGPAYCIPFLRVLNDNSIPYFCITSEDLHARAVELKNFRAAAILTHDEYYTDAMFDQVQGFLDNGGKLVVAGGNTMYRRAHAASDESDNQAFYVNFGEYFAEPDRKPGIDGSRAEESLLGATYALGGWPLERAVPNRALLTEEAAAKVTADDIAAARGFTVTQPDHWLFTGLDVSRGDVIGSEAGVMDIEIDGVRLDADGAIDRDLCAFVPADAQVLAVTEIGSKHFGRERVGCLIDTGVGKGRVINFGTVGLVNGLIRRDDAIVGMVENAFKWAAGQTLGASRESAVQFGLATQKDKETYDDQSFREDQTVISAYYDRIFADFFAGTHIAGRQIVDIGPGLEHYFVDILLRNEAIVWTIDFSMDVVAKSRERNLHAIAADLRSFPLELLAGRFDGVFCRGSFNPFWFATPEEVYDRAMGIAKLMKPDGWSWIAPYNAISQFSGRDTSQKTAIIDAQRRAFEDCGYTAFELSEDQQKAYRITRAITHPLFVKNLPTDVLASAAASPAI